MRSHTKHLTPSLRAAISLLGPAFVAAIAYVDPGNFATNLSAGSQYSYQLVWVLVVANAMASLMQYLSAKVGLVTGLSLPEIVRDRLSSRFRIAYWLQAEFAAIATDVAEVLGGAIALQLLFRLPLLIGGSITGVVSMVLLIIHGKHSQKVFERVILGLLLLIPIGFVTGLIIRPPQAIGIVHGLVPSFQGQDSILLAAGILGATVMPHVVYLHSALARDRHGKVAVPKLKSLLQATRVDIGVAMIIAGSINIAMFLLAAAALHSSGHIDTLNDAYSALRGIISPVVATLFAIGLLVSGLASTSVGCYAGSVVMEGLLHRRISLFARRFITLVPALIVIGLGTNPTKALILSQVILSFTIPFAVIPLIKITSHKKLMGQWVNTPLTTTAAWSITSVIVALNAFLIVNTIAG